MTRMSLFAGLIAEYVLLIVLGFVMVVWNLGFIILGIL